jgi:Flp pilus assembly protein TadG
MTLRSPRQVLPAFLTDRAGSAMAEFAVTLPAFVMLMFGVIEIGRGLWLENALHYAVEQAARCYAAQTCYANNSNIPAYAATVSGAVFPSTEFTASTPSCGFQVVATHSVNLMIPFYHMTWTFTAKSCFPGSILS